MRIVVGVSGDRVADAGLVWGLREAALRGVPVVAVHARPAPQYVADLSGVVAAPWTDSEERARDRLDSVVKAARDVVPDDLVDLETRVVTGSPTHVLETSTTHDDILVLTREHVTVLSRLVHGSVSRDLLRRGLCAAVVVPAAWQPTAFPGRVVVGVDRSAGSLQALAWAASESERRRVPLVPVLVRSILDGGLVPQSADADRADLERWVERLHGVPDIRPQVLAGEAGQVLVHLAAADDLVVVGRTGAGASGLADRLLGSTSLHVVRHASCPVVVTPA